jgi:succinate dehydrogenase / fumarate reductase cytochrome b subunit
LHGPEGFLEIQALLSAPAAKLIALVLVWALSHHLLAGIRYLLIDIDMGVELPAAKRSAWAVNVGALVVAAVFLGALVI